ncbi:MAG: CRISPR-associated endonuclease Cas4/Cas1 [Betaproteobacteria bacterium RIFCSPLOWO2_12_FULL_65_14]|nr:MAG: CRISPR-associated endonuclease Cas4/Cas1 [Betaproteobacteria bacterium RIFCSPLOWO2_12_FULL_65_14]
MPDEEVQQQPELPLPFPELAGDLPLLPARMLNEHQYCPRLAYLEWVQGEWAESADTVDGRRVHRRVDRASGELPAPEDIDAETRFHARSITLSSNRLGLIAKMDLVEAEDGAVVPVDYKRGKRPHVPKGAYDPERVQLCAQGMILEEHGYRCDEGVLYFAESKERVRVPFDAELRALTQNAVDGMRLTAVGGQIPPPLVDSPKCPRCSLVGICLPDEVNFFKHEEAPPRPLAVQKDDALPVYVQAQRAKVAKSGETLEISIDDQKVQTVRLGETSQLVLWGNVYVTTPTLHELMAREVTVSWHSHGGWFLGHTIGTGHKNVEVRTAQYRASFDGAHCLRLSRGFVVAKIQNARTLLRRNWKAGEVPEALLDNFRQDIDLARRAKGLPELLGAEGNGAARYFREFRNMLSRQDGSDELPFDFTRRNRRPPSDPVNALLSFAYALLVRAWTVTLSAVGFDPYRGFYHQPRYGRPALALDLMEPFRPLVADSAVILAINNGEVKPTDFIAAAGSVALNADGRKRFIAAFERRLSQEVTHPEFGYRIAYRRLFELQARLLARHLLGELEDYPNFVTR